MSVTFDTASFFVPDFITFICYRPFATFTQGAPSLALGYVQVALVGRRLAPSDVFLGDAQVTKARIVTAMLLCCCSVGWVERNKKRRCNKMLEQIRPFLAMA